jgi:hypothetical protein
MRKSRPKPEMTSPMATSTYAITTTATSISSDDIIKRKIENATEGLPLIVLAIFLIGCYLHLEKMLLLYAIIYLL